MSLEVAQKAPGVIRKLLKSGVSKLNSPIYLGKKGSPLFLSKRFYTGCTAQSCNLRDKLWCIAESWVCSFRDQLNAEKNPKSNYRKSSHSLFVIADTDFEKSMNAMVPWVRNQCMVDKYMGTARNHIYHRWERDHFWDASKKVNTKDHNRNKF